MIARLRELTTSLKRAWTQRYQMENLRLDHLTNRPVLQDPLKLQREYEQHFTELQRRLGLALMRPIQEGEDKRFKLQQSLERQMSQLMHQHKQSFGQLCAKLDGLSPLRVLSRGYAYVTEEDPEVVVTSIEQIKVDDTLRLRLADGSATCEVRETKPLAAQEARA